MYFRGKRRVMKNNLQELDLEWVALIAEAKNIGLKKEDILNFLAGQPAVDLIADNG
ncbi:hypothetical protein B9K06_23320 [Bacillus sp. OG2]|nr:hypothetical protein B9K06_23320 [Bacillus sp. OG2]